MTQDRMALRDRYVAITPVVVPIYAIMLAMLLGAVVILLAGGNPLEAYGALIRGAVGTPDRVASSLARSTPSLVVFWTEAADWMKDKRTPLQRSPAPTVWLPSPDLPAPEKPPC